MKRKQVLLASLVVPVVVLFFAEVVYSQSDTEDLAERFEPVAFSAPFMVYLSSHDQPSILNQSTRNEIYSFIRSNPGTHFRGICDRLELSVGVVQYHLQVLTRAGLLSSYSEKKYRRYFQSKRFAEKEMQMISLLRRETAGRVLALLAGNPVSHKDLALRLGISSQALSWQMSRLENLNLVNVVKKQLTCEYTMKGSVLALAKQCCRLLNLDM